MRIKEFVISEKLYWLDPDSPNENWRNCMEVGYKNSGVDKVKSIWLTYVLDNEYFMFLKTRFPLLKSAPDRLQFKKVLLSLHTREAYFECVQL